MTKPSLRFTAALAFVGWFLLPIKGMWADRLPVWRPADTALDQLGPEKTFPNFRIRPPKGFTLQQRAFAASRAMAWTGSRRGDGTRALLMVTLLTPPSGPSKQYTSEAALSKLLRSTQRGYRQWSRTATEQGRVNGALFSRAFWTGVDPSSGRKVSGFMYVTSVGSRIIHIASQDVEPHHRTSLKLAEAAALTFRKR